MVSRSAKKLRFFDAKEEACGLLKISRFSRRSPDGMKSFSVENAGVFFVKMQF